MQQNEALKKMVDDINKELEKYLQNKEKFKDYTQTMQDMDKWLKEQNEDNK